MYFNFHVNIFTVRSLAVLFDSNGFNSDFSYTNVFYRGVRTNVINGIAGKKIRNSTSFNMYEIFSFFNLIVSKIKIKLLNF